MGTQDLKKSLESMEELRAELSHSNEETLAFLVEAGIVTAGGDLADSYQQPS